LPGWQALYKELKDKNFEIISVAQDTGGAKDAGPWITAAKPEYTALVDEQQIVTQKYGMVNVPTAVWINEKGHIVRPNEVAFIDDRFKSFTKMDSAPYIDAIRDWAAKGAKSIYVMSESELKARLKPRSNERVRANAEFALAEYLYKQGKGVAVSVADVCILLFFSTPLIHSSFSSSSLALNFQASFPAVHILLCLLSHVDLLSNVPAHSMSFVLPLISKQPLLYIY